MLRTAALPRRQLSSENHGVNSADVTVPLVWMAVTFARTSSSVVAPVIARNGIMPVEDNVGFMVSC